MIGNDAFLYRIGGLRALKIAAKSGQNAGFSGAAPFWSDEE